MAIKYITAFCKYYSKYISLNIDASILNEYYSIIPLDVYPRLFQGLVQSKEDTTKPPWIRIEFNLSSSMDRIHDVLYATW